MLGVVSCVLQWSLVCLQSWNLALLGGLLFGHPAIVRGPGGDEVMGHQAYTVAATRQDRRVGEAGMRRVSAGLACKHCSRFIECCGCKRTYMLSFQRYSMLRSCTLGLSENARKGKIARESVGYPLFIARNRLASARLVLASQTAKFVTSLLQNRHARPRPSP